MRSVDIVFYACDTDENTVFLELLVSKADIAAEPYLCSNIFPVFFRPYSVKFSAEGIFLLLIVKEVFNCGSEHVPFSTAFVRIVPYIFIREHHIEHDVGVFPGFRDEAATGHHHSVYFLRHYFEASAGFARAVYCLSIMIILHVKLSPCKFPGLKDYSHLLLSDWIVFIVEFFRDSIVDYVIEVLIFVNLYHSTDCPDPLGVVVASVKTILRFCRGLFVYVTNRKTEAIYLVVSCVFCGVSSFVLEVFAIVPYCLSGRE